MSDIKAAEQIASEGGPPTDTPVVQDTPAQAVASSEGGAAIAPVAADASAPSVPAKTEGQAKAEAPADVAGQKHKKGFLQKLMPWKKEKK